MKVLFVCRANVGRSQIAEAILANMHPDYIVTSAGTAVDRPGEDLASYSKRHPGHSFVIPAMKELGIDVRNKRRDQVQPAHLKDVDRVVSMAESEPSWLVADTRYVHWDVADPGGVSVAAVKSAMKTIRSHITRDFPG